MDEFEDCDQVVPQQLSSYKRQETNVDKKPLSINDFNDVDTVYCACNNVAIRALNKKIYDNGKESPHYGHHYFRCPNFPRVKNCLYLLDTYYDQKREFRSVKVLADAKTAQAALTPPWEQQTSNKRKKSTNNGTILMNQPLAKKIKRSPSGSSTMHSPVSSVQSSQLSETNVIKKKMFYEDGSTLVSPTDYLLVNENNDLFNRLKKSKVYCFCKTRASDEDGIKKKQATLKPFKVKQPVKDSYYPKEEEVTQYAYVCKQNKCTQFQWKKEKNCSQIALNISSVIANNGMPTNKFYTYHQTIFKYFLGLSEAHEESIKNFIILCEGAQWEVDIKSAFEQVFEERHLQIQQGNEITQQRRNYHVHLIPFNPYHVLSNKNDHNQYLCIDIQSHREKVLGNGLNLKNDLLVYQKKVNESDELELKIDNYFWVFDQYSMYLFILKHLYGYDDEKQYKKDLQTMKEHDEKEEFIKPYSLEGIAEKICVRIDKKCKEKIDKNREDFKDKVTSNDLEVKQSKDDAHKVQFFKQFDIETTYYLNLKSKDNITKEDCFDENGKLRVYHVTTNRKFIIIPMDLALEKINTVKL